MNTASLERFEYSERRIINNRNRRNKQLKQRLTILAIVVSLFIIMAFAFIMSSKSMASNSEPLYKYYKSVRIEAGDTLYNLSDEFVNPEMNDTESFITEVRYINNLEDDSYLYEGNYIIVPYYDVYHG